MFKPSDLPHPIRPLAKEFCKVAGYRHRPSLVFEDFITYCLYALNMQRTEADKAWYSNLKERYTEREYEAFIGMWYALLQCYHDNIDNLGWYDPLGDFYMEISARSTKSAMGQFFTPMDVCQMMVEMQFIGQGIEAQKALRVNDCACGSARLLLAFHAKYPGNFVYGEDLDGLCAKMSVVNMAFHGCVGWVRKMDTLSLKYHWGYAINPLLNSQDRLGVWPLLSPTDESWMMFQPNKADKAEIKPPVQRSSPDTVNSIENNQKPKTGHQLSLF